jgi:hypothetical protein
MKRGYVGREIDTGNIDRPRKKEDLSFLDAIHAIGSHASFHSTDRGALYATAMGTSVENRSIRRSQCKPLNGTKNGVLDRTKS